MKYTKESLPGVVKAISLIWIMTGIIFVLIAIWGFAMSSIFNQITGFKTGDASSMPSLNLLYQFVHNIIPISIYSIVFGSFGIICSIFFRKFKKWSLKSLIVMSWITIAKLVAFMIFWIFIWKSIFMDLPPNSSSNMVMQFIGLLMFVIACLAYVVIMVAVLKKLNSESLKSIFS
jgi:hypothetical protein